MRLFGMYSITHLRLTFPLLISLFLSPPVHANDFREGLNAYLDGDYETAHATWRALAESGHPAAQHSMGTLYTAGRGVPEDHGKATKWFRLAAEQGHPAAQFSLGNAYRSGRGVPKNDSQAAKWWKKAADQGFAPAQANLGSLYYAGGKSTRDREKGLKWYRKAASNGSALARKVVNKHGLNRARPMTASLSENQISPTNRPAPDMAQAKQQGLRDEAWLLQQSPRVYTIQLSAARSEENIRRFVSRHGLVDEAAYFRLHKQGETWYSLLYGTYSDYGRAKQVLDTLPASLRQSGPWVRTMASVQKAITKPTP